MESQKFEELEGVDQEEGYVPEKAPEMKEYEKLLLAESNREMYEKAINLIKFGCFSQEERPEVDFSQYTKIETEKKYKGLYTLYWDNKTMDLVFICPLVENNKGDLSDEKKDMKPYAYDCIVTEAMDNETYQMVSKAAKNNLTTTFSVLFIIAWVVYGLLAAFATMMTGILFFTSIDDGFNSAVTYIAFYNGSVISGAVLCLPLMILLTMKYKQYKEK